MNYNHPQSAWVPSSVSVLEQYYQTSLPAVVVRQLQSLTALVGEKDVRVTIITPPLTSAAPPKALRRSGCPSASSPP